MAETILKATDIDALRAEIRKVRLERVTYQEILEEMAGLLREKVAEGAFVKVLAGVLTQSVKVGERSLNSFLATDKLQERKPPPAKTPEGFLNSFKLANKVRLHETN